MLQNLGFFSQLCATDGAGNGNLGPTMLAMKGVMNWWALAFFGGSRHI